MVENFLIFAFSLFLVVKGATLATKYSAKLAEHFSISKYIIGFVVVAFISILPETLISVNAAITGIPEFGLGTLFGSNIADLTLIFAILILVSKRGLKVESKVLKNIRLYPFFLLLPILLGLDGHYSRIEGAALILSGAIFYYQVFKNGIEGSLVYRKGDGKFKDAAFLVFAMVLLLIGSHFTVVSATDIASAFSISPILIGLLIVSLGTTMPELFYSIKALRKEEDGLAIGDIMGSVLADATVVIGILALINPFYFPTKIIYVTGIFMLFTSLVLLRFMRSGQTVTRREGFILLGFWGAYALIEIIFSV